MTLVHSGAAASNWSLRSFRPLIRFWAFLPLIALLGLFFFYPVGQLLTLSVLPSEGGFTTENYARALGSPVYLDVLAVTFKISGWTTLFAVAGGFPVAYLLAVSSQNRRNALLIWVLVPFWTSFLVRTFAWMIILGRSGPVNQLIISLGITSAPVPMLYNMTGTLIGMAHAMLPLAVMTMLPVMQTIDPNLNKAADTLGASKSQAFWRIYFPQCMPGISAAAIMVFITSLGFFITPALLGGSKETMLTQVIIVQIQELLNWSFASTLAVILLVASLIVFFIFDRMVGLSTLAGQAANRSVAASRTAISRTLNSTGRFILNTLGTICELIGIALSRVMPGSSARVLGPIGIWTAFILIAGFLVLPALLVVPASFTAGNTVTPFPAELSLRWYETLFDSPQWMSATWNSVVAATLSALVALVIGTMAAFVLVRQRVRGKTFVLALILSPLIVPRIVIAVALFYLYSRMELVATMTGLVIAHAVLAVPYVVITVMAVLTTYDRRYDDAAATMGANSFQILRYITLPIIKAGLVSAFLFAFVTSFDELTVALFISGGAVNTLPRQLWSDLLLQINPTIAAAASILLVVMLLVLTINEIIRRRASVL